MKKKICSVCNQEKPLWKSNPPTCKGCYVYKPKDLDKSNEYYQKAIEENKKRNNGVCRSEECHIEIKNPKGRSVCHVLGKGTRPNLYYHPLNHFILCYDHTIQEESGKKSDMKIHAEWTKRRFQLLQSLL